MSTEAFSDTSLNLEQEKVNNNDHDNTTTTTTVIDGPESTITSNTGDDDDNNNNNNNNNTSDDITNPPSANKAEEVGVATTVTTTATTGAAPPPFVSPGTTRRQSIRIQQSKERVEELLSIKRTSSVKEIRSKFSGASKIETQESFQKKVRVWSSKDRMMNTILNSVQRNPFLKANGMLNSAMKMKKSSRNGNDNEKVIGAASSGTYIPPVYGPKSFVPVSAAAAAVGSTNSSIGNTAASSHRITTSNNNAPTLSASSSSSSLSSSDSPSVLSHYHVSNQLPESFSSSSSSEANSVTGGSTATTPTTPGANSHSNNSNSVSPIQDGEGDDGGLDAAKKNSILTQWTEEALREEPTYVVNKEEMLASLAMNGISSEVMDRQQWQEWDSAIDDIVERYGHHQEPSVMLNKIKEDHDECEEENEGDEDSDDMDDEDWKNLSHVDGGREERLMHAQEPDSDDEVEAEEEVGDVINRRDSSSDDDDQGFDDDDDDDVIGVDTNIISADINDQSFLHSVSSTSASSLPNTPAAMTPSRFMNDVTLSPIVHDEHHTSTVETPMKTVSSINHCDNTVVNKNKSLSEANPKSDAVEGRTNATTQPSAPKTNYLLLAIVLCVLVIIVIVLAYSSRFSNSDSNNPSSLGDAASAVVLSSGSGSDSNSGFIMGNSGKDESVVNTSEEL